MIEKVISGGQTGADLAGLRAAASVGIFTGGWAPKGFLTENGPRPALLKRYFLREHSSSKYPPRTAENISDSDATLIFARNMDGGSKLTRNLCFRFQKPVFWYKPEEYSDIDSMKELGRWLQVRRHAIVNIAGNRESKSPGIEQATKNFLVSFFRVFNRL